jgi:hypothetical protein
LPEQSSTVLEDAHHADLAADETETHLFIPFRVIAGGAAAKLPPSTAGEACRHPRPAKPAAIQQRADNN